MSKAQFHVQNRLRTKKEEGLYSSAHRTTARAYVDICIDADTDIALLDLDFAGTFEGEVECASGFDPGRS